MVAERVHEIILDMSTEPSNLDWARLGPVSALQDKSTGLQKLRLSV